ncbi:MAG: MarR family transcriptional regulator [Peptococcaceae bacterium]|nr:MarR family transcriptional regulator [Peptococcaceae bacterium]
MSHLSLAGELREMIRLLMRRLGVLEKSEASCCGITLGQCHALIEIGRAGEISLNELAELLNVDNSTMSRTVNNLVSNELIERVINPEDRRYVKITLTEKGEQMFKEIEENMGSYFKHILEAIPEDKHQQVVESLRLLMGAFKKANCC